MKARQITAVYTGLLLSVFPLLCAPYSAGNAKIKYAALLSLTGGYVLCVLLALAVRRTGLRGAIRANALPLGLCWLYVLLTAVSAILSPYDYDILLGMTRREGMLTQVVYALIFSGALLFGTVRPWHKGLMCLTLLLNLDLCWLQFLGLNPLGLYGPGADYYGGNIAYNGQFLGTVGNSGLTATLLAMGALLCLALAIAPRTEDGPESPTGPRAAYPGEPQIAEPGRLHGTRTPAGQPQSPTGPRAAYPGGMAEQIAVPGKLNGAQTRVGRSQSPRVRRPVLSPQLLWLLPALLGLLTVAKSGIAAGAVAIAGGLALLLPASLWARGSKRWPWALALEVLLGILALILVYFHDFGGTLHELHRMLHGYVHPSYGNYRIKIWSEVLAEMPRHLLWGTGPDTMAAWNLPGFISYFPERGTVRTGIDIAHCEYLNIAAQQGLLALGAYLGLLAVCLVRFFRGPKSRLPLFAALSAYLLSALFSFSSPSLAPLLWLTLGLLAGRQAPPQIAPLQSQ